MIRTQYITRHHELPLVRAGGRVAVFVAETSEWFRRSVQGHLRENVPVQIDAAEGYAYALRPRGIDRPPVLARRLVLRWSAGRLFLDRARGTDGELIDLRALLTVRSLEEIAREALDQPAGDGELSRSGLSPALQSHLAETAQQEMALRLALLSRVQEAYADAFLLCTKLLTVSFGGHDPGADLYQQAAVKFETVPYAPHLRDLVTSLLAAPLPSALRTAAKAFCCHLQEAGIETEWAADLLKRSW